MLRTITIAGVLACGAMLPVLAHADLAHADEAQGTFMLQLEDDTTPATVIEQIAAAGRDQLVVACESTPAATVRILNPLASGDYADLACSTVLDNDTWQTSAAPSNASGDGRIGEAQQRLTPVGPVLCGLLGIFEGAAMAKACSDWRGRNSQFCNVGSVYTSVAWLVACTLMF